MGAQGGDANPLAFLRAFDAFPKQREEAAEFFHRSVSGGVITLVASFFMVLLFFSELRLYLTTTTTHELVVDASRGETLDIHFDVTLPRMPCAWVGLDAMDASGEVHLDVEHAVFRQRLAAGTGAPVDDDAGGVQRHAVGPDAPPGADGGEPPPCGSCYGAETAARPCCATCADVRAAYEDKGWGLPAGDGDAVPAQCRGEERAAAIEAQRGEGCRLWGRLTINKVAGNFHFAPGRSYQAGGVHVHDLTPFGPGAAFDFSHRITRLAFGSEYPGMRNPLDGAAQEQAAEPGGAPAAGVGGAYQYFLKVVPTEYREHATNRTIASNQYAVSELFRAARAGAQQLPGLFLFYDLSPIRVRVAEARPGAGAFLTGVCAIVGGVWTVSGLAEGLWHGQRTLRRKVQLGKLS